MFHINWCILFREGIACKCGIGELVFEITKSKGLTVEIRIITKIYNLEY